MKIVRILFAGIVTIGVAAAIGWYVWDQNTKGLPEGIATGNGRVEAEQIDIATRIPGRISEIFVREGDLVNAGQTLAVIDTSELESQIAQANADVMRAVSQVEEVRAMIAQREAEKNMAEEEYQRAKTLADKGVNSKVIADQKLTVQKSSEAALSAAMAQLNTAKKGVDVALAVVNLYKTQLADATLKSPTFGRVLYRLAQPGEVIGSGGKIITVLDLSQVYMEMFLPADQSMQTAIGAEARIKFDGIPFAIPAYVSFVSPEAQFTPKQVETQEEREKLMFRVKVRVPEELVKANIEQVKTGLRGVAYIRLAGAKSVPWPEEAGQPIPGNSAVGQ